MLTLLAWLVCGASHFGYLCTFDPDVRYVGDRPRMECVTTLTAPQFGAAERFRSSARFTDGVR